MKNITVSLLLVFIITGCSSPFAWFGQGIAKELKKDYILAYPDGIAESNTDLIYLITPGGGAQEAKASVAYWLPYLKSYNLAVAAPIDWSQEKLDTALTDILASHQFGKIFVTGFSNGGYNSCTFGFDNPERVDGIIPMGAYCSATFLGATPPQIPVLVVAGEKDKWARGEDLQAIEESSLELEAVGIDQQTIIVPGIGHQYPVSALPQVIDWIRSNFR